MRIFVSAAMAIMAFGLVSTTEAVAAAKWECTGSEFVCGPSKITASKAKATSAKAYYKGSKTVSYKAKSGKKFASTSRKSGGKSYSGGGSSGMASYYSEPQALASGGRFNPNALTAAHKTLPFGTRVRVTNMNNGRSVVVTINDRGPFIKGRVIDLSRRAAQVVGMTNSGVARVSYSVVGRG